MRLGADRHGVWCGLVRGTVMSRPGVTQTAAADHVTCVPHEDWWLATFYGSHPVRDAARPFDTYVDIATPCDWQGEHLVRAVDLDLDVIRGTTGRVWIDDEDEFAEHRSALGYPHDVVEHAMESCTSVLAAVQAGEPPFDGATAAGWLALFREKTAGGD
ncbi:DUF402 domain-containing protein [Nocardioides mangrovicus]|uniref:DUF402 domain-containing protein n=2 Tax=Nocardioides mangrovicus TaxID=2478913 RepID=A0A3L8P2F6_9ACTN|nr:DUF402 domain-containing protein [Nocardioides mangrovicus]